MDAVDAIAWFAYDTVCARKLIKRLNRAPLAGEQFGSLCVLFLSAVYKPQLAQTGANK